LLFRINKRSLIQTQSVTHSYSILNQLEILHTSIANAETGVRGFVITKDERFLEPYNQGMKKIWGIAKQLNDLVSDNPKQQELLDTVNHFLHKRLIYMSKGLSAFRKAGMLVTDSMRLDREDSKNAMDSLRQYIGKMDDVEMQLMNERESKLSGFFNSTQTITIISLLTAIAAILYSLITYNKESRGRLEADKKTVQYRLELEKNISELQGANTELHELRSIEKFASTGRMARTIAHEVRNPLTNISLAAEQLQEMSIQNEDSNLLLDMISRNATRINQLVADLLNATKFVQLDVKKADINQLLDETLVMARDRIELGNIKVEKKFSSGMKSVYVDPDKIRVAFLNIIVNAIEAMEKDKGVLQLKTFVKNNNCIIEIRDNGTGMDEDTLQKLFEPYFTAKMKGNGLGLTNTQNIILHHKGNIKVNSTLGQGTIFIITLNLIGKAEEIIP
jgi:signal transduction histidine kinase